MADSGVSGLAGILVYLAEHFEAKLTFPDAIFSWGFILDTTACFAIVVIAIIISLNNHKPISLQGQDVECSGSSLNEGNAEVPRATGNGDVVLVNVIEETSEFQGDEHVNRDEKERVAESRL
nr:hypothetical protein BaRGS_000710 [Batillaria attramentaria]